MSDHATVSTVPPGRVIAGQVTPGQVAPGQVAAQATAPITRSWRTEDWIAVVLGFLVITTVLVLSQWKILDLRNVVPTFRWTTDSQIMSLIPGWSAALDQIEHDAQSRQEQNGLALSKTLRTALASGDRNAIDSAAAKMASLVRAPR